MIDEQDIVYRLRKRAEIRRQIGYRHENVEAFGIYSMRVLQVTQACKSNILQHFGVTDE